jgi:hypothetical protein
MVEPMETADIAALAREFFATSGEDFVRIHTEAEHTKKVVWAGPYSIRRPLGPAWQVTYDIWVIKRVPFVGTMCVEPRDPAQSEPLEPWSGNPSLIPDRAPTTQLLRQLASRVARDLQVIRAMFSEVWRLLDLPPSSPPAHPAVPGQRRGRPGRSDLELARLAQVYVSFAWSRHPVVDVAGRTGYSEAKVRAMLHVARERDLLQGRGRQGIAYPALTARGNEVLAAARARRKRPTKHQTHRGKRRKQ